MVRFAPPPPRPRWVNRRHIADVLAQLTPGSVTRVRLGLMHWTGMRPSQMGRLRAEDFRLDEPIPYVAVPLVPEGPAVQGLLEAAGDADTCRHPATGSTKPRSSVKVRRRRRVGPPAAPRRWVTRCLSRSGME